MDKLKESNETDKTIENSKALGSYLRAHGLSSFADALRSRYQSLGTFSGTIRLDTLTPAEVPKVEGLLGLMLAGKIRLTLKQVLNGLDKSVFYPYDLLTALEEYYGKKILTKPEKKDTEDSKWQKFFEELMEYYYDEINKVKDSDTDRKYTEQLGVWLSSLSAKDSPISPYLSYLYSQDKKRLNKELKSVILAIIYLNHSETLPIRLAKYASEITRDPHYFDFGNSATRLLLSAMSHIRSTDEEPGIRFSDSELLREFEVQRDDISNSVITFGISLFKDGELDCESALTKAAIAEREPLILPVHTISKYTSAKAGSDRIYVVENPVVFMNLMEDHLEENLSLICTYGQLRASALILLDMLFESKTKIYYSGDFDPEGLQIAQGLIDRYGDSLHLWHMDISDYHAALSNKKINATRLKKLNQLSDPSLQTLANELRTITRAGYQENIEMRL